MVDQCKQPSFYTTTGVDNIEQGVAKIINKKHDQIVSILILRPPFFSKVRYVNNTKYAAI